MLGTNQEPSPIPKERSPRGGHASDPETPLQPLDNVSAAAPAPEADVVVVADAAVAAASNAAAQSDAPAVRTTDAVVINSERLHILAKLTSQPLHLMRPENVLAEIGGALGAQHGFIHNLGNTSNTSSTNSNSSVFTLSAQYASSPQLLDDVEIELLARELALLVQQDRAPHRAAPALLNKHFADKTSAVATTVAAHQRCSYLGVPLFSAAGTITHVVGIIGARVPTPTDAGDSSSSTFSDEDVVWVQAIVQLLAAERTCAPLLAQLSSISAATTGGIAAALAAETMERLAPRAKAKPVVLVVDDDRAVNTLICRALRNVGYDVESAEGAAEALQMFDPERHRLVLSDIMMPKMNGWQLVAELRKRTPSVPAILITGYSTGGGAWNQTFLRDQGIVAVLSKPIDNDYLLLIVADVLSTQRS